MSFLDVIRRRDPAFTGEATPRALKRTRRAFERSPFSSVDGLGPLGGDRTPTLDRLPDVIDRVALLACRKAGRDPGGQLMAVARAWAEGLIDPQIFEAPSEKLRQAELARRFDIYRDPQGFPRWADTHAAVVAAILRALPTWMAVEQVPAGVHLEVELIGLAGSPKTTLDRLQAAIMTRSDNGHLMLGSLHAQVARTIERVTANRSRAASDFGVKGEPVTIGRHPSADLGQLTDGYFAGTAIPALIRHAVPIVINDEIRSRHSYIMGGSGSGKSHLVARQIVNRLPDIAAGRASMVVIDPKCQLVDKLLGLGCFDPEGALARRTWLIDPSKPSLTPRLSPWGLSGSGFNQAIDSFSYLMGEVGDARLYARQKAIFGHFLRLMMVWPKADLNTLRQVLKQPSLALDHLDKLPKVTRAFFVDDADLDQTRDVSEQMRWRLDGLQTFDELNLMLNNAEASFDPVEVLNGGALVLARLPEHALSTEQQSHLGRALVAMVASVITSRYAAGTAGDALPGDVVIDECQMVFQGKDDSIARQMLATARGAGYGFTLIHQNLGQLDPAIAKALVANTGTRIIGRCESKDARYFAENMGCPPDLFPSIDESGGRHFVIQINGRINHGTVCHAPSDSFADAGRLSAAQQRQLMTDFRARFRIEGQSDGRPSQAADLDNIIPINAERVPL